MLYMYLTIFYLQLHCLYGLELLPCAVVLEEQELHGGS